MINQSTTDFAGIIIFSGLMAFWIITYLASVTDEDEEAPVYVTAYRVSWAHGRATRRRRRDVGPGRAKALDRAMAQAAIERAELRRRALNWGEV